MMDEFYYKHHYNLKNLLKNKNHNNIIFFGNNIDEISDIVIYCFKKILGDIFLSDIENKLKYYKNNKIYLFNSYNIYDKDYFLKFLKDIVSTYNHYNKSCKYIIINNYQSLSINIQKTLKVLIEKYYSNVKFIFITNRLDCVDKAIQSRCITIRYKNHLLHDKYIFIKNILNNKNIVYNPFLLLKQCNLYSISDIIHIYEYGKPIIIIDNIVNDIIEIMFRKFDLEKIQSLTSKIKEVNIELSIIYQLLLNKLIKIIIDKKKISLIIKELANNNHIIKDSYRELIHIESLIISIYCIIND